MTDEIQDKLSLCSLKLEIDRQVGTCCFVTPNLAITCAHVIPKNYNVGDEFIFSFKTNEVPLKAEIIRLLRNIDEDLCIFSVKNYQSKLFVVLGDDVSLDHRIYGYGFPLYDGLPRSDAFAGKFESKISSFDPILYPHGLYKFKDTNIRGGFSGGPGINLETGYCIGIVTESRDSKQSMGGFIIPSSLILEQLSKLNEFTEVDKSRMLLFWQGICKKHNLSKESNYTDKLTFKLPKRIDEIYVCNREEFSRNFEQFFEKNKDNVHHYLIVGSEHHSPIGLARKLIYEFFTKRSEVEQINYPCDPNIASNRINPLKLKSETSINTFLQDLYSLHFNKSENKLFKLWNIDQSEIYQSLMKKFVLKELNIIPVEVIFGDNPEENKKIFVLLKEFIKNLKGESNRTNPKIIFFWCICYYSRLIDQSYDIIFSFLKEFSLQEIPRTNVLDFLFPYRLKKRILKIITSNDSNSLLIKPVNKNLQLKIPPRKAIEDWVESINLEGTPNYEVPIQSRNKLIQEKTTKSLEKGFLDIILQYNKNLK